MRVFLDIKMLWRNLGWAAFFLLISARFGFTAYNDITFFAIGDTHLGYGGYNIAFNEYNVDVMNYMLPRTAYQDTPYGPGNSIAVNVPVGVVITGDLTDFGSQQYHWDEYERIYGLDGTDGLLNYPVYECLGNHDHPDYWESSGSTIVTDALEQRRGLIYSWDWGTVHMVSCGLYPDALSSYPNTNILNWLEADLAKVGPERAVIIFFHFNIYLCQPKHR